MCVHEQERGREREREKAQAGTALSAQTELYLGLQITNLEIMT